VMEAYCEFSSGISAACEVGYIPCSLFELHGTVQVRKNSGRWAEKRHLPSP
jgi:hypothetical protein